MCAYYLGKNNTGDLASILTGAYNVSSPSSSLSRGSSETLSPQNTTTQTTAQECAARGVACRDQTCANYRGTAQLGPCMTDCMGDCGTGRDGDGDGGDGTTACQEGKTCAGQSDCGNGECVGRVVDPVTKRITPGKCNCTNPPGDACKTKCLGKGLAEGTQEYARCYQDCVGGSVTCDATHPCTPPKICDPTTKKCVDPPPPSACTDGKGPEYTKNPAGCPCGTGWSSLTGNCGGGIRADGKPYYFFVPRSDPNNWKDEFPYVPGAKGTCQCETYREDWEKKKKGLGEYKYPPEMQALMDLLLNRGKELMGMPLGYSQDAQDKMFGRGFENVRGQEAGARTGMEQGLSRSGMLGTGAGQGMLNDLSWNTEGNVANLARDLFVGNEVKKKQDLLDYSKAAQSMLGSGMSFQQLLEAINSSRRGEGSAALQALLAWLMSQK